MDLAWPIKPLSETFPCPARDFSERWLCTIILLLADPNSQQHALPIEKSTRSVKPALCEDVPCTEAQRRVESSAKWSTRPAEPHCIVTVCICSHCWPNDSLSQPLGWSSESSEHGSLCASQAYFDEVVALQDEYLANRMVGWAIHSANNNLVQYSWAQLVVDAGRDSLSTNHRIGQAVS